MTHAYVGLVSFDLVAVLAGGAILVGLGLVRRAADGVRCLGLAFLTGWAALGVVLSLAAMAGVAPGLAAVLVVAGVLVLAGGLSAPRAPALLRAATPAPRSGLARAAALAGGVVLVGSLLTALLEAVRSTADASWDVWDFWLPKAEAIYYFHGLDTGPGGFTTFANPEYPPLVPLLDAAGFDFSGGVHAGVLPLQQCLLLVGFVGSLLALLRRVPSWILLPLVALVVLSPQVWGQMLSVLPDSTLAYLLAVAAVAGILWLEDGARAWLVLAAVFLAAAALTKPEGVLLGALLAVVLLATASVLRGRFAPAGLVLVLGPAATIPWRVWLAAHAQPVQADVYSWGSLAHPVFLAHRFDRLTYATGKMADLLADSGRWSAVLPLALAALIVLAPVLRALSAALAAWIVVAFFGLATVYWIGTPDVHWYVSTSAYRVVANLPVVAGAVLPLLLGIALERDSRTR